MELRNALSRSVLSTAICLCPSYTSHCCESCSLYKEMTAQHNKVHCYCVSSFYNTFANKVLFPGFQWPKVDTFDPGEVFQAKKCLLRELA